YMVAGGSLPTSHKNSTHLSHMKQGLRHTFYKIYGNNNPKSQNSYEPTERITKKGSLYDNSHNLTKTRKWTPDSSRTEYSRNNPIVNPQEDRQSKGGKKQSKR